MSQRQSKQCKQCKAIFRRHPKHGKEQWCTAAFCSVDCSNKFRSVHGMRHTRLYRVWAGIKNRCGNKNDRLYSYYGARGITFYWRDDFAAFAAYMGEDPGKGWDVGRIDNDIGYAPGNVEWQTEKQNARNKRTTYWVEYQGRRMCLAEAAEIAGVNYKIAWQRLERYGWTLERALQP